MSRRVHFVSLGCPKNRIDTETMLASLGAGLEITTDPTQAEVVIVNTCAFIEAAKRESVDTILEIAELKQRGRLQQLVVAGCLAQRYPEELARELPEVDHFVGTADVGLVQEILDGRTGTRVLVGNPDRRDYDWEAPRENTMPSGVSAYLKIAEGCSNTCAFCVIPSLRGPQRSRPIESIVAEAARLVAGGVSELNLVAQDSTAYGYDLRPRLSLTALLRALLEQVPGAAWIRLLYAYPRSFPAGLTELMATEPRLVPYLDMPLQHISDSVLARMRRGTRADTIRRRVAQLRERVAGVHLRTTFLVGFPGETDGDFRQLLDFVRAARFEKLGAFAFSREEGTLAHDLDGQVPEAVKAARLDELMYTQRDISRAHNEALVGARVQVLVEGPSAESEWVWAGRTPFQAPEIDGTTYLADQREAARPLRAGDRVEGVVAQATDYDLLVRIGEPA